MDNEEADIHTIISGCKAGDRRAQEKLYRSFYRVMMNLCLRYTKNEADAMSVLNTGFYKVFKNIEGFKPGKATLYTWIRTIVIHSCLDFIKAKQKHPATKELDDAGDVPAVPDIISKMKSEDVLHLVRQLPAATRAVFNLYIIEGYSHKEIGALLQISEGTSKWHLSEARKILKLKIHEQYHP